MKELKFYCLVVGSRDFEDYETMCSVLDYLLSNHSNIEIVSGGARGADRLAERYAKDRGYELTIFPADWSIGRNAGYIRNEQMHKYIAEHEQRGVVAFWNGTSKGTAHNFKLCKTYNNPTRIYNYINNTYAKA